MKIPFSEIPPERTSESLVVRLTAGIDDDAWEEFYRLYWRAVYGYALRFSSERSAAEDIVQEVFVKIMSELNE